MSIGDVGSLSTCTSMDLVLLGVQSSYSSTVVSFYFKLVLFIIYLQIRRPLS
jgi:hypothetical protein